MRTHNLVVRPTRIVSPRRLLHDPSRHGLEVHQIETLLQRRHARYALLPPRLVRVFCLLLLLDRPHIDGAKMLGFVQVLVECVGRMDRFVFLRRIAPGILEDDFGTAGMFCL